MAATRSRPKTSDLHFAAKNEYVHNANKIVHELELYNIRIHSAIVHEGIDDDAKGAWWFSYLAGKKPVAVELIGGRIRVVDLFCGAGGLANGVGHLCDELGVVMIPEFIADQDELATEVYAANHGSRMRSSAPIQHLVDYSIRITSSGARFTYPPELMDEDVAQAVRGVDLVLAGPPCQGHSNLNNHTRRTDPRNSLYLTVPAFAVAAEAPMCIIENVPGVVRDEHRVVEIAQQLFESEGYHVTAGFLSAADLGWPQTRRRHFLIARKDKAPVPLSVVRSLLRDQPRSLWWAIGHLEDFVSDDILDQVSELSPENRARIEWLFREGEYELALTKRPESHRNGTTYTAVYGRMKKELPAPTITTGFMTPGRGRFVHPTRPRVLTPREAARLQGFPDNYRFVTDPSNPPGRSLLAKWIGDAVPMPLGYAAAISALAPGFPGQAVKPGTAHHS